MIFNNNDYWNLENVVSTLIKHNKKSGKRREQRDRHLPCTHFETELKILCDSSPYENMGDACEILTNLSHISSLISWVGDTSPTPPHLNVDSTCTSARSRHAPIYVCLSSMVLPVSAVISSRTLEFDKVDRPHTVRLFSAAQMNSLISLRDW